MTNDLELFEAFFQKSKAYYTAKLTLYREGQKFSFNASAFLAGRCWFMYRKMYLEAIIIFFVIMLESFFEDIILANNTGQGTRAVVNIITTIAPATTIGFLGNYLYLRKAGRTIQTASIKYAATEELKKFLQKKGGVSFIFLLVIIAMTFSFFIYNNYSTNNGS